ncbi:uncharacterized protein LOC110994346 [Pieris rapae]|uniref:uncharacterized protein LOC110994346 n=1 Tax=Pieris rapae TaxID=64459 RepID=UPI001E27F6CC|nr:uncharacterized protein LOC110994346 [Pieris rapae]
MHVLFQQLRSSSGFGRVRVLCKEFLGDIKALWKYGAPFPTFLKLIGTLLLCLIVMMPLIYPLFIFVVTYVTCESLFLSWWLDQPGRFQPVAIIKRGLSFVFRQFSATDTWKVREVLTRAILLAHSFATSVDYLCVMQGLLDET